eukprot:TCONS_00018495-protein
MTFVVIAWFLLISHSSATFTDPQLSKQDGAFVDSFHSFNTNDFTVRFTLLHYLNPDTYQYPTYTRPETHFQWFKKFGDNRLNRGRAYFIPPTSGVYKFHVACKARCQFDISDLGFDIKEFDTDTDSHHISRKQIGADISFSNFKS